MKFRMIEFEGEVTPAMLEVLYRGQAAAPAQLPPPPEPGGPDLELSRLVQAPGNVMNKPAPARRGRPPVKSQENERARGAAKEPAAALSVDSQPAPRENSLGDKVLTALKKRPMTSPELAEHLKLDVKQVYSPCKMLKDSGLIESFVDETGDGQRRYRVPG